jgi:hypothetical protein
MRHLLHLLGLLIATACMANVIRVPEDYETIQGAIYQATDSDTISVDDDYSDNNAIYVA